MSERTPVVLVDRLGYGLYKSSSGRSFLPVEEFDVSLVTDIAVIGEARGEELAAVVGVNSLDVEGLLDAARFLYERSGSGNNVKIVSISEFLLLPLAELRQQLGLRGPTPEQVLRYRDKPTMKAHLRARGIRVPEFAPASAEAVDELFHRHATLFAKPRRGAGSKDVELLRGREEAGRFLAERSGDLHDFEVEEFIDGTLYHVDSVVDHGRVVAATAGRTIDPTTNYRAGLPCRDIGVAPGETLDLLLRFNREVLHCFADFVGVTHHEIFLTDDGPVFCEIAGRPGGGGIVAGYERRTGANLIEVALRAQAAGGVPQSLPVADRLTGFSMIYGNGATLQRPVESLDEPWMVETQILAGVGEQLRRPRHWGDAVAVVTAEGDSEAETAARLNAAVQHITAQLTS